ncbi:hypothetical protein GCM10010174_32170 [Kutzneria viridogrisea]
MAAILVGSTAGVATAAPAPHYSTCSAADLNGTLGQIDPGVGQRASFLTLTANQGASCTLSGYLLDPRFVDGNGALLPTRAEQEGAAAPPVTVGPGHAAELPLRWTGIPVADGDDPDAPAPAALEFSLDGVRGPVTVTWTGGHVFNGGHLMVGSVRG